MQDKQEVPRGSPLIRCNCHQQWECTLSSQLPPDGAACSLWPAGPRRPRPHQHNLPPADQTRVKPEDTCLPALLERVCSKAREPGVEAKTDRGLEWGWGGPHTFSSRLWQKTRWRWDRRAGTGGQKRHSRHWRSVKDVPCSSPWSAPATQGQGLWAGGSSTLQE